MDLIQPSRERCPCCAGALGFCLHADLLQKGLRACDGRTGGRKRSSFSHGEEGGSYMLRVFIKLHLQGGRDSGVHRLVPLCVLSKAGVMPL